MDNRKNFKTFGVVIYIKGFNFIKFLLKLLTKQKVFDIIGMQT